MALQAGKGKVDGKHYLPSTPETISWGELPTAGTRPVLTVDSGATVTIDTISQEGILEDQGRDPDAFFGEFGVSSSEVLEDARAVAACGVPHRFGIDGPHVVTGPVYVREARPGDVLRIDVVSLHPRARYGVVSARHGVGLLAGEFPEGALPDADADARHWRSYRTTTTYCQVERRRGKLFGMFDGADSIKVRFPLTPFLGIMSVGIDRAEPVRSTSVGRHGGALDCRELGPGARLFLPVQVPGALFAVGDPHYSLGDGKVAYSALDGPLRATVRLTALREPAARSALGALREPFVESDISWMTLGLDVDFAEALRRAARSAVLFLHTRLGLSRADAIAYLSAAADFGICQVVNDVHAVYCRLRRADFNEPTPKPIRRGGFSRIVGSSDNAEPTPNTPPNTEPNTTPNTEPHSVASRTPGSGTAAPPGVATDNAETPTVGEDGADDVAFQSDQAKP